VRSALEVKGPVEAFVVNEWAVTKKASGGPTNHRTLPVDWVTD